MTDAADMYVRAPRTVEEALSLIAAGVGVITRGCEITPDQNRRIAALATALTFRKEPAS